MSNQLLGDNLLLGVTPNRKPTNFFLHFHLYALHEPIERMKNDTFFMVFYVRWSKYTTSDRYSTHKVELLLKPDQ